MIGFRCNGRRARGVFYVFVKNLYSPTGGRIGWEIELRYGFPVNAQLGQVFAKTGTDWFARALIPIRAHLLLRTGELISGVMRRLLTGYAVAFSRRHRALRHSHLF
jgi:hypothetical protein